MATTVYVCDNEEIKKRLADINKLKQKDGYTEVYVNDVGRAVMKPTTYLIMIKEDEILSGLFVIKYADVIRQLETDVPRLINACTPTKKGDALFALFTKHFTDKCEIQRKELFCISSKDVPANDTSYSIKAYAEEMKLIWWAKSEVEQKVNEILDNDFRYDMFLMPLFYEAEKMRENVLKGKARRKYRAFVRAENADIELSGIVCNADGKPVSDLSLGKQLKAAVYISEEKEYEPVSDELHDFFSLAAELESRICDIKEALMKFYIEGLISFPITTERFVNSKAADKMASSSELSYAAGISKAAFDYTADGKKSQQAGGIMLLKNFSSVLKEEGVIQGIEKNIMEVLMKRQSELGVPKKVREEKIIFELDGVFVPVEMKTEITSAKQPKLSELNFSLTRIESEYENTAALCTIQRLITLMKINAFPLDLILDILLLFDKSSYVNYYGGEYVVKRSDRKILMSLPPLLTDISFPRKVLDMAAEVSSGKANAHEFSENISAITRRIEEELRKKEKQNEK